LHCGGTYLFVLGQDLRDGISRHTGADQIGRDPLKQVRRLEHAEIILNHHEVIRQFSAQYQRDGGTFTLLLLERRYLYEDDRFFLPREERRRAELMILEDDELLIGLNHYAIKLARMMELLDLVIAQSDRVRRLFGTPA